MQDHTPAILREFIHISRDDFCHGGGWRTAGLDLFADTMNRKIAGLRAVVADDLKPELLALCKNLLPAVTYGGDTP